MRFKLKGTAYESYACGRMENSKYVLLGLQEFKVSSVETVKELIEKGNATRSTGTTGANEESSHSHAILQLAIKRKVDGISVLLKMA